MPTCGYRGKTGEGERKKGWGERLHLIRGAGLPMPLPLDSEALCSLTVLPLVIAPLWSGAWPEMGAGSRGCSKNRKQSKHGLNSSLIGIKYIWFTPALSTLPRLYKVGTRLLPAEMSELPWRFALNYSAPLSPFLPSFFVGITEF